MDKKNILVVCGDELSGSHTKPLSQYNVVLAPKKLEEAVRSAGGVWMDRDTLIGPGSIYEASAFAEELSRFTFSDGSRIAKSFTYEGYELWWIHYNDLFYYFGLPYARYKKLLEYVKDFENVHIVNPQFPNLFKTYLTAYDRTVVMDASAHRRLPFGIILQILITFVSIPVLMLNKRSVSVFAGDKFEQGKDFDFRMRFVYKELRARHIPFMEFIRSLEPAKKVLEHAWTRRRPVVYSEAVLFVGRFLSFIFPDRSIARRFDEKNFVHEHDPEKRFRFFVATQYIRNASADVWAIRIMKWIIKLIGIKGSYFSAALDRNFHAVLGCKLNAVPTVGILHGVASKHYNVYDFMPGFDGEKSLSLDAYGVWSNWWKEYYSKNSRAYTPERIFVSGPMRPLEKVSETSSHSAQNSSPKTGPIKVLFVSEQLAVPEEIIPYVEALLAEPDIEIMFTFRQYKDGFKEWILQNKPDLLNHPRIQIASGGLQKAIEDSDVAVGSHSTAVLEMLLKLKVPLFFNTQKWGDYYELADYDQKQTFFAKSPAELVQKIKNVRAIQRDVLKDLQERYFGDPYKNGSAWVVDEVMSRMI